MTSFQAGLLALLLESELLQEIIIIEPKIKNSREIFRVNISSLPSRTTYLPMFAKAERKKKAPLQEALILNY